MQQDCCKRDLQRSACISCLHQRIQKIALEEKPPPVLGLITPLIHVCPSDQSWAAQCNSWLLIKLTLKREVFPFLFSI